MNTTNIQTKMTRSEALAKARAARSSGWTIKTPLEKWESSDKKSYRLAIDAKCWECSHGQREEIAFCAVTSCPLHCVRPYQKG